MQFLNSLVTISLSRTLCYILVYLLSVMFYENEEF